MTSSSANLAPGQSSPQKLAKSKFEPLFLRKDRKVEIPDDLATQLKAIATNPVDSGAGASIRRAAAQKLLKEGLPQSGDEAFSTVRLSELLPKLGLPTNHTSSALTLENSTGWTVDDRASFSSELMASLSELIDTSGLVALALTPSVATVQLMESARNSKSQGNPTASVGELTLTHLLGEPTENSSENSKHSVAACQIVVSESSQAQLGIQLRTDSSSSASVPESGAHLASTTILVELAAQAELDLWISDFQSDTLLALTQIVVQQAAGSQLRLHLGSTGTALSRTALRVELAGPEAHAEVLGTAALSGNRQSHRYLHIIHQAPGATSKQLFKTVAADTARSSVDGTIEVAPMAKGTAASQTLRNLLLGETARVDSKPRLLIRNDDVKCNHGSTTGQLDATQRFYLRSRGLTDAQAVALLTGAFLHETLDTVPKGKHRDAIEFTLNRLLNTISPLNK